MGATTIREILLLFERFAEQKVGISANLAQK
jgi:hypothetical protein